MLDILIHLKLATLLWAALNLMATPLGGRYTRSSVDVGIVVRNIESSVHFYEKVLGLKKAERYTMTSARVQSLGLTDGTSMNVQVMALGDAKSATKIRLLEMPGQPPSKFNGLSAISLQLGFRYITLFVSDLNRMLKRLSQLKKKPIYEGPVCLGGDSSENTCSITVHDPDGNLIELVGPKMKGGV